MAWIESHQSLATHRKTLAMRRLLGINKAQVIGHLHLLWWWCLDNAPDGDLSAIDPADIAIAMDWNGDANTIIGALVNVGFIDNNMHVHSWDEYAGKLLIRRADNAERQKRHREKELIKLKSQMPLLLGNGDITVTSQSRNIATVPNRTQQKSTEPNSNNKDRVKKKYGQFNNVLLSDEEYDKLKIKFNSHLPDMIENLSLGIESKGYKYKSHYATILTWARRDDGTHPDNTQKNNDPADKFRNQKYGNLIK